MEVVIFSTFSTMMEVTALWVNFISFKLLQTQMRPHLKNNIVRIFCSHKNTPAPRLQQEPEQKPTYIPSKHLQKYLHQPTTTTQKRIKNKMYLEWIGCLTLALFIYMNSEDILPGSWLSDNMWMDFHDKYPHRVNKIMQNNKGAVPRKYSVGENQAK